MNADAGVPSAGLVVVARSHRQPELQALLDTFVTTHNQNRPHRSLEHRATAYAARPKAVPATDRSRDSHDRVRRDTIDASGCVTLRVNGRLHNIGIGRTHARAHVLILVQDLDIRIIDAATGELLRQLVLDPSKDYQGTGQPPGPARRRNP